jgi:predicted lipase
LNSISLNFRSVRLNSNLRLVPRLGMRGAVPQLFHVASCHISIACVLHTCDSPEEYL